MFESTSENEITNAIVSNFANDLKQFTLKNLVIPHHCKQQ